jgi:HIT zinc finger
MTDYATPISPLTKLPLCKVGHFRSTTRDSPPVRLDESTKKNHTTACRVCRIHHSRYACPRCGILYCSVACYQAHTSSSDDNADHSCTEGFYQDRVHNVLQLEQKAKKQDTLELLRRHYSQQVQQEEEHGLLTDPTDVFLNVDNIIMKEEDETEKLLELLALLELQGDNPDDQQLVDLLAKSPGLKSAFEESLRSGHVQHLVLRAWDPWWTPVLSSACEDTELLDQTAETLEERLLRIKPFDKLLPKGKPVPNLTYNLVEVIYCTAYVLRLYHGVDNGTSDDETATEAAMTIIQASSVLNQDARYFCLERVMMDITQSKQFTITSQAITGTVVHPSWTTIALDVAAIMDNKRMMGRALLEVLDILKAAIAALKKRSIPQQSLVVGTDNVDEILTDLRRKRKKVEYYLSWSQHPAAKRMIPKQLPNDICAWLEHWKPESASTDPSMESKSHQAVEELLGVATTGRNEQVARVPPGRDKPRAKLIEILD